MYTEKRRRLDLNNLYYIPIHNYLGFFFNNRPLLFNIYILYHTYIVFFIRFRDVNGHISCILYKPFILLLLLALIM